jgi:hypothetical protein
MDADVRARTGPGSLDLVVVTSFDLSKRIGLVLLPQIRKPFASREEETARHAIDVFCVSRTQSS